MYYLAKKEYDYAIRICAYLAGSNESAHFSIQHISSKLLIPKPFATKIIFQLKQNKILNTTRGKNGGVLLAVNSKKLTLFQIFETFGMEPKISECIKDDAFCPLPPPCKIHKFFIDHEAELINKLKNISIDKFAFSENDIK